MKLLHITTTAALLVCILVARPIRAEARSVPTASARYAQINREIGRCKVVKRDLEGYSSEGGTLRAYLLHGSPRKIVAHYYGAGGQAIEEYYFWNNRLFFVLRANFTYQEPLSKLRRSGEHRFYFSNGKLVRWQKDRNLMTLPSQEAKDYEESTLLLAREFLQKVRS